MDKKTLDIWLTLIFLTVFFYYFFLTDEQTFSLQSGDDLTTLYNAKITTFSELLKNTFTEKIVVSGGHAGGLSVQYRPFRFLIIKIIYEIFGTEPSFYYFMVALFFAGTIVILYLFSKDLFNSKILLILLLIFFMTIPSVTKSVILISDFDVIAHFFILSCFLILTNTSFSEKRPILQMTLLLLLSIFALKTKETAIILPLCVFCYTLFYYKKRIWHYFLYFLLFAYYIIPYNSVQTPFHNSFNNFIINIVNKVLLNPDTGFGPEQNLIIFKPFSALTQIPGSLLSSLGPFLPYIMIISIFFCFFYIIKANKILAFLRNPHPNNKKEKIFLLFAWLSITILGYGFFDSNEIRYLFGGLIPLSIILFIIMDTTLLKLQELTSSHA